jgi:hypothetical protein
MNVLHFKFLDHPVLASLKLEAMKDFSDSKALTRRIMASDGIRIFSEFNRTSSRYITIWWICPHMGFKVVHSDDQRWWLGMCCRLPAAEPAKPSQLGCYWKRHQQRPHSADGRSTRSPGAAQVGHRYPKERHTWRAIPRANADRYWAITSHAEPLFRRLTSPLSPFEQCSEGDWESSVEVNPAC